MIEGWQKRGIPLHIVLRAIESVFDKYDKNPGPRTIKGLLYCREEVEAQYQEWLTSQIGRSTPDNTPTADQAFTKERVNEHIHSALEKLRACKSEKLHEYIDRACVRLEGLRETFTNDFETVDKSLSDIEHFLDQGLLSNFDRSHLKNLERETTAQLKSYKSGMDAEAYEQTFRLMLLKRLREEAGVPRLSLFHL